MYVLAGKRNIELVYIIIKKSPELPHSPWPRNIINRASSQNFSIKEQVKVKVKLALEQAMKAHGRSRGIALLFL